MSYIRCPTCDEKIFLKANYAGILNVPCPECNQTIPENAIDCPICGYPIQRISIENKNNALESYNKAMKALNNEDYDQAKTFVKHALELFPDNSDYHELKLKIETQINLRLKSHEFYLIAKDLIIQGSFEEAELNIDNAIKLYDLPEYIELKTNIRKKYEDKKIAEYKYLLANKAYLNSEFEQGLILINEAITLVYSNDIYDELKIKIGKIIATPKFELAQTQFNNKDYKSSLISIKGCLELSSKDKEFIDFKSKVVKLIRKKKECRKAIIVNAVVLVIATVSFLSYYYITTNNRMNEAWSEANITNTITAYENYLKVYPSSKFSSLALSKIEQISNNNENEWKQTLGTNTLPTYYLFINKHPESSHIQQARDSIKQLVYRANQLEKEEVKANEIITIRNAFAPAFKPENIKGTAIIPYGTESSNVTDSIKPIKNYTCSISEILDPNMIVWTPTGRESVLPISEDGNCYTSLDTILSYTKEENTVDIVVFGTYYISEGVKETCHACAPVVSIALMEKDSKNIWRLIRFEKDFGVRSNYGLMPRYSVIKFGDQYFLENKYYDMGMGVETRSSIFYHLPELVESIRVKSLKANQGESDITEQENWVEKYTDISYGNVTKILITKKGKDYDPEQGQFKINDSSIYELNRSGVFILSQSWHRNNQEGSVAEKIINNTYLNNSNGLITSISFRPGDNIETGAVVLNQLGCNLVFSYKILGTKISITFFKSDCGRVSQDNVMYYDEQRDNIYMYIEGVKFVFTKI